MADESSASASIDIVPAVDGATAVEEEGSLTIHQSSLLFLRSNREWMANPVVFLFIPVRWKLQLLLYLLKNLPPLLSK